MNTTGEAREALGILAQQTGRDGITFHSRVQTIVAALDRLEVLEREAAPKFREARMCSVAGCPNLEDPRFGGKCDGH